MRLSDHFTLEEMTHSQIAARNNLRNEPPDDVIKNLLRLASSLEEVRSHLCRPVLISSGYRSSAVNQLAGGARTSAHIVGLAADITVPGVAPRELAKLIAAMDQDFDQIILEYDSWVHVGLSGSAPRRQLLTIRHGSGYLEGIA